MGRKRKNPIDKNAITEPFAFRLPVELAGAMRARAEAEGISPSELGRNIIFKWFYQESPSANEGYYQARGNALRLIHFLMHKAYGELPQAADEVEAMLAAFEHQLGVKRQKPGPKPKSG